MWEPPNLLKQDGWRLPQDTRQRIADKAYALYEQRGRRDGYDLQDWLDDTLGAV